MKLPALTHQGGTPRRALGRDRSHLWRVGAHSHGRLGRRSKNDDPADRHTKEAEHDHRATRGLKGGDERLPELHQLLRGGRLGPAPHHQREHRPTRSTDEHGYPARALCPVVSDHGRHDHDPERPEKGVLGEVHVAGNGLEGRSTDDGSGQPTRQDDEQQVDEAQDHSDRGQQDNVLERLLRRLGQLSDGLRFLRSPRAPVHVRLLRAASTAPTDTVSSVTQSRYTIPYLSDSNKASPRAPRPTAPPVWGAKFLYQPP